MQRYANQLIEDLEEVAAHPPPPSYIEIPMHMKSDPVIAEVALVPFKTIQELTGIDEDVFPQMDYLTDEQMEQINAPIFKIFESLNIELIYKPEYIPPGYLYEAILLNWNTFVQYLPSLKYDLDLCTHNIETCP